jgi:hypothetical protein
MATMPSFGSFALEYAADLHASADTRNVYFNSHFTSFEFNRPADWYNAVPPSGDSARSYKRPSEFENIPTFPASCKNVYPRLDCEVEYPLSAAESAYHPFVTPYRKTVAVDTPSKRVSPGHYTPAKPVNPQLFHAAPSKPRFTAATPDNETSYENSNSRPFPRFYRGGSGARRTLHLPATPSRFTNPQPLSLPNTIHNFATRELHTSSPPSDVLPPVVTDKDGVAIETDLHKIQQREKQIGYGKSTKGYANYIASVPMPLRDPNNEDHPATPRAWHLLSKRSWDGQLKTWRRLLHRWDTIDATSPDGSEQHDTYEDTDSESVDSTQQTRSLPSPQRFGVPTTTILPPGNCAFPLCLQKPTRIRSWASECSDTSDYMDLSEVTL